MSAPVPPRVLSLPEDHAYIASAYPVGSPAPAPLRQRQAEGFDRHPAFDLGWLTAHAADYDLVHLHFGYDAETPAQLRRWASRLEELGLPLIVTVHDLRNPHHHGRELHDAQLDVLLAAAAEVLTLTPGAAAEIFSRSGRVAVVVPHSRILAPAAAADDHPGASTDKPPLVGIFLKARAQVVAPDRVVAAALAGADRAGARLRVDAHPDVLPRLRSTVALAHAGRLDLNVGERLSAEDFAAYLRGLAVSVLPYRFGTHSGWLEACRDVGVRVVAPDCGFYAEQWDEVVSYTNGETWGLDEDSLTVAVTTALRMPALAPVEETVRREQTRVSAELHRAAWSRALAGRATMPAAAAAGPTMAELHHTARSRPQTVKSAVGKRTGDLAAGRTVDLMETHA